MKRVMLPVLVLSVMVAGIGCSDKIEGERRGRLGGNGSGGSGGGTRQEENLFDYWNRMTSPPGAPAPRARMPLFDRELMRERARQRANTPAFSRETLPPAEGPVAIAGALSGNLAMSDGRVISLGSICLQGDQPIQDGSSIRFSPRPCPADNARLEDVDMEFTAKEISIGRPNINKVFEIIHNGVAIGRFLALRSFVRAENTTPIGFRYQLMNFCTSDDVSTRGFPLAQIDYKARCAEAGLTD